MNSNGHRCESYPCYYCNREIYFSSSPPTTFMCLDKRISIQVGSLEKISKEYNKYRSDSLYSSKMIDAEVQTTSSYISDKLAETSIEIPKADPLLAPFVYALPIQLLAYFTAVFKGTDVDQPRNLAKSVTVE